MPLVRDPTCRVADSAVFQQIEIEEASDPKHGPTLRLFGVSEEGNSCLAHVYGFRPYFYVAAPAGFLNKDLESFKDLINVSPPWPILWQLTKAVFGCNANPSGDPLRDIQSQVLVGLSRRRESTLHQNYMLRP